jgi:hypothetical protein
MTPRCPAHRESSIPAWKQGELKERPSGDPARVAPAARPRWETTLTVRQIAGRLHTGSCKSLNNKPHRHNKLARNAARK